MLPARHRLRRRTDIERAVSAGRRAGRPTVVAHYQPVTTTPPTAGGTATPGRHARATVTSAPAAVAQSRAAGAARVGFAVGRRVGGAVVRNRVRRRLRHLMAARLERLPAGSVLLLRAAPAAATAPAARLALDLDAVLGRVLG